MTSTPVIASEARQSIPVWLTLLAHLYPPKGTLLIGAGAGNSPWVKHLQTENHPNVTLVEADEAKATRLKTATQNSPHWQVKQHVIAQHAAPTQFYTASMQTESGLIEPESLRSLWPNLKTTDQQTRQAASLAELQADAETPANWLLVDCMPALSILQGAAKQLAGFDVIATRVLLQENSLHNSAANVDQLQLALEAIGFQCVAIETSRHPAIGHALFVRDTVAQAQAAAEQAKALAEQAQAQAVKVAAEQLVAERQAHGAEVQQIKDAAEQAKAQAEQAQAQATKVAADQLAAERQAHGAEVQQLKDAAEQAKAQAEQAQAQAAKVAAEQLAAERQAHGAEVQQLKDAAEQAQDLAAQEAEKAKVAAAVQATQHAQTAAEALATATTNAASTKQAEETRQHLAALELQLKQQLLDRDTRISALELKQISLIAQREKLQRVLDEAISEQTALTQALDEKEHALKSLQAQQAETFAERARLQQVNERLSSEMTRAQAQIDLIQSLQLSSGAVEQ
jgi:hypothetical protein